ncbi:hypothetical protein N0V94_000283 [Neodidymelliopsis sp. IMI 364377]|nr:hypothetical protein N0V94_000283 [Neodidymelliopsis sp. IMI 364377]
MAATTSTGLRALRSLTSTACASCRRPFTQSTRTLARPQDDEPPQTLESLMSNVDSNFKRTDPNHYSGMIPSQGSGLQNLAIKEWDEDDRHKLNIYATKHNTHITLAKPNRDSLISVSCGNIGFRKAGRGSYDAGYQLAAFVMSRIKDKGLLPQIQKLELVYRGFGSGREAVTKAILGAEGKKIRPLIVKLSDSTRLKFGGVRSKKPRRLG